MLFKILTADKDFLTGLANRNFFNNRLAEEYERILRYGGNLSLIMLDIDHFKDVNDIHGHAEGDDVLRFVSQVVEESVRSKVDVVARWGGEEFIILLPQIPLDGAMVAAEHIRKNIEGLTYRTKKSDTIINCTISLGVSELTPGEKTKDFIENADKALLKAKELGRNRVVSSLNIDNNPDDLMELDSLTGLMKSQQFRNLIDREIRKRSPFSLLTLQLDCLDDKKDRLLPKIALIIQDSLRKHDVVAYSG